MCMVFVLSSVCACLKSPVLSNAQCWEVLDMCMVCVLSFVCACLKSLVLSNAQCWEVLDMCLVTYEYVRKEEY